MQQDGGNSYPGVTTEVLIAAQQSNIVENPEERLVIVKVPREKRPFNRENVVDALLGYGIEFEAVGRFSRGLEFQVLLENRSDADRLAKEGYMEISNMRGLLCGCVVRKFTQKEFRIWVDWLPVVTTEEEVGRLFSKYGNVIKVYKELAPQVQGRPRYWGGGGGGGGAPLWFVLFPKNMRSWKVFQIFRMWRSEAESTLCSLWYWGCRPDATGAEWGDTWLISVWRAATVVAAATHLRSTRYRTRIGEVLGKWWGPQHEYDMEDESAEVRGEVENLVDASEPGPLTQMLQDSQGTGGGDGLNKGKREEVVVDKLGEVEVEGLGEGKGASVEGELSEEGSQGGESGEVLRTKRVVGNRTRKEGGKSKGGEGGQEGEQSGGNKLTVTLGRMGWVALVHPLGSGVRGGFRLWALLPGGSMEEARERGMRVLGAWTHRWPLVSFLQDRCQRGRESVKGG